MPHTMVTFRLHRSGVILLAIFCIVLAILIFAAGYLTATYKRKSVARDPLPVAVPKRPVRPPERRAEARPTSESLTLRIAVLTSEEDAKAQVANLTAMGLQPSIIQMPTTSGVTLHNVVVGRFETRAAANEAARKLQSRLGFLPVVVPAPPPPNL